MSSRTRRMGRPSWPRKLCNFPEAAEERKKERKEKEGEAEKEEEQELEEETGGRRSAGCWQRAGRDFPGRPAGARAKFPPDPSALPGARQREARRRKDRSRGEIPAALQLPGRPECAEKPSWRTWRPPPVGTRSGARRALAGARGGGADLDPGPAGSGDSRPGGWVGGCLATAEGLPRLSHSPGPGPTPASGREQRQTSVARTVPCTKLERSPTRGGRGRAKEGGGQQEAGPAELTPPLSPPPSRCWPGRAWPQGNQGPQHPLEWRAPPRRAAHSWASPGTRSSTGRGPIAGRAWPL